MIRGCVNGELFKYSTEQQARAFLDSSKASETVKERFIKYWHDIQKQKQNAAFRYERQQAEKLREAKLKARGRI